MIFNKDVYNLFKIWKYDLDVWIENWIAHAIISPTTKKMQDRKKKKKNVFFTEKESMSRAYSLKYK